MDNIEYNKEIKLTDIKIQLYVQHIFKNKSSYIKQNTYGCWKII